MIDTLVFSGGGIKGIGFVGCLNYLSEKGLYNTNNIKTFIGTSAGSIIATFLAVGYTVKEINEIAKEIDFGLIRDITADNVLSFFQDFGLDSGKELERVMEIIIKKKTKENLTFKELYDMKGIKLIINAVCVNDQKVEYFNHETYPDLEIRKAIRMSTSIPIVFKPYKMDNKLYVDGGVLDNFSVNLCDKNFIGFYIVNFNNFEEIKSIDEFLYSIITAMLNHLNNSKYIEKKENIICMDLSNITSIDFELSKKSKIKMIEKCYNITKEFFMNKEKNTNDSKEEEKEDYIDNIDFTINEKNNSNQDRDQGGDQDEISDENQDGDQHETQEENQEDIKEDTEDKNKSKKSNDQNFIKQIIKDINFNCPVYIENSSLNDIMKEICKKKIKNYLTK